MVGEPDRPYSDEQSHAPEPPIGSVLNGTVTWRRPGDAGRYPFQLFMMASPKPKRRWLQFSLRALLILFLLVAIGMSWLSVKTHQARKQREAVEAIEKSGGSVNYDYYQGSGPSDSRVPNWARAIFGTDFFFDVVGADAYANNFGDNEASYLKELANLEVLELINTQVTDAGLKHLAGLTNLKELLLTDTKVADAGLEYLKGLTNLELLDLSGTQVTDAGLKHLEGLTNLKRLSLRNTKVANAGLEHLNGLTNLEGLDLSGTQITDAGLEQLEGLTKLTTLGLEDTQVTDAGVTELKKAFPNLRVLC